MNASSILRTAALAVALPAAVMAQTNAPVDAPPPNQVGAYELFGTLTAGYRVVSVNAGDQDGEWFSRNAENLFQEQFNLTDSGFALGKQLPLSLDLFASRREGEAGFFDQLFVNAEVNPTVAGGSVRLRRFGTYDLKLGYSNVDYFYDRYDSLFHDLRRYETNRSTLNASLDVSLLGFLGVGVSYRGVGHGGTQQMPRPMFIEGAGGLASYMAVSRLYYLTELPRTDWNSDFSGSINADLHFVDVTVGGGVTSFTEDYVVSDAGGGESFSLAFRDTTNTAGGFANEFGIVGDQTARERLLSYSHTEARELSGPYFFGQAVIKPIGLLRLTADFRMDNLDGTTIVATNQVAEARKTNAARAFQLYRGAYSGDVTNTLERLRTSFSATVMPIDALSITAGWRLQTDELSSHSTYRMYFDSTTSLTSGEFRSTRAANDSLHVMEWVATNKQPSQTLFGSVIFTPIHDLTLSAGIRSTLRSPEVTRSEDGESDSVIATNMSKETSGLGFDFGASLRLMSDLRLRARFEMMSREATFSDDPLAGGPAAGTVTDLEPRTAPEDRMRVNVSADWDITEQFSAGVRFGMQDAKADLNESMWVLDGTQPVELVDDNTVISGLLSYRVDDNTLVRLSGETRSSHFSIPVTWTRGQELITPIFPVDPSGPPSGTNEFDSSTVVIDQQTDDLYIDFGVQTRLIDMLSLGAGVSYLAVTGEPTISPEVKNVTSTPTRQGDVTRVGGPFNRTIFTGNVGFDITPEFGIGVNLMYAMQDEETLIDEGINVPRRFYGYDDYNGLSMAFNVIYNF
ncbi:MAG TPA: hypothetical protein VNA88_08945 [Candidatus Kapabacteria bacterium]|nr:hypothetical protein [Candidatus Kapabacteria bacterium]